MLDERRADGRLDRAAPDPNVALRSFAAERFRGTRPIAWGDQLTELWLGAGIMRGTMAADALPDAIPDADGRNDAAG